MKTGCLLSKLPLPRRVLLRANDSVNVDNFWQGLGDKWSHSVQQFTDPSKALHDAVSGIVATGDSDLDKAKKLYAAVQAFENTDFTREKSKAERKQLKMKR
jgi:hypothetical protein